MSEAVVQVLTETNIIVLFPEKTPEHISANRVPQAKEDAPKQVESEEKASQYSDIPAGTPASSAPMRAFLINGAKVEGLYELGAQEIRMGRYSEERLELTCLTGLRKPRLWLSLSSRDPIQCEG
ncbi:MAG: hypothetical protein ACTHLW_11745 [Verrucomicrobiota bacterium]